MKESIDRTVSAAKAETKRLDRICLLKTCHVFNYLASVSLVSAAVVRFTKFKPVEGEAPITDPFFYIMTVYLLPIAVLMMAAQYRYSPVLKYFEFLSCQLGKALFYALVSLMLFDTDFPVDVAISVALMVVAVFNLFLTCLVPGIDSSYAFSKELQDLADGISGFSSDSDEDSEESSENDNDEYDGLIPKTYSGQKSNEAVRRRKE